MKTVKCSVRNMVEKILRSGDIDSRYVEASTMQDGAKAHRKIQKSMGKNYRKEVSLSTEVTIDDIEIKISGRADGIIDEPDGIVIDEIKSTTLSLDSVEKSLELFYAQAMCYAYMYLPELSNQINTITLQITLYQLESKEIKRQRRCVSVEDIKSSFHELVNAYYIWIKRREDWNVLRDKSIKSTNFPFNEYRKGQRELAVAAYNTIRREKKLYVQAPTGIGKTVSTIFPSIKAIGEGLGGTIFYLTAKTITRQVAEHSFSMLASQGLRFKSITITAKDKICFCEETICNPDYCPYAKGHYDRVLEAVKDILDNTDLITRNDIEAYAKKHNVCPYEFSLDISEWADGVICDYNYVFDPVVYLKRFFSDDKCDCTFLIDEAHNLPDRVREMYSATIDKTDFYAIKKALKGKALSFKKLRKSCDSINQYFIELRKKLEYQNAAVMEELTDKEYNLLYSFVQAAEEWLSEKENDRHELHNDILALFFNVHFFLTISELYDEKYKTIVEIQNANVSVTLFCMNPSQNIKTALDKGRASVLFSATLTPLDYYRNILGGTQEDWKLALPSPFDRNKLRLIAHCGISTKYNDREDSIEEIVKSIDTVIRAKKGNYMVYFPSYQYMNQVLDAFKEEYDDVNVISQSVNMSEEQREMFLNHFNINNDNAVVGFCVMGGIFSEGIDLEGERLIGTVIVGIGLPKISFRLDLIKDYFNSINGMGYEYAYTYPGMNKVLQAAGRVIRSETDSGIVLLIDTRFNTFRYQQLYPKHWCDMKVVADIEAMERLIEQ